MTQEQGCSSHACLIAPPKGMGTNSGKCYCPQEFVRKYITTLRAEVERLTRRNELLEEWRKMDESELTAKVEEMGMRVNKRHDIIAERKAIAREIDELLDPCDSNTRWVKLRFRILAGEFAKEDK